MSPFRAEESGGGAATRAPSRRDWRRRLEDPDEPLFTVAVAADLLDLDTQAFRRLSDAFDRSDSRPSGNQRRYSRNDIARLADAIELIAQGHARRSVATILLLTARLEGR